MGTKTLGCDFQSVEPDTKLNTVYDCQQFRQFCLKVGLPQDCLFVILWKKSFLSGGFITKCCMDLTISLSAATSMREKAIQNRGKNRAKVWAVKFQKALSKKIREFL